MNGKDNHKYDDIIHMPHHISQKHPQMSAINRAAQFSPFAALTGHGAAIRETERLTEEFVELDEDRKEQLDRQLKFIQEHIAEQPEITVTYFCPDERKEGGAYRTMQDRIKKIDAYTRRIIFTNGTLLPMEYLYSMEGKLFQMMDDTSI